MIDVHHLASKGEWDEGRGGAYGGGGGRWRRGKTRMRARELGFAKTVFPRELVVLIKHQFGLG
jgi:hypothetical protein